MIELALQRHAATPATAVRALRVQLTAQPDGALSIVYTIDADPGSLLVPPPAAPQRRDELWRHSCFELFVATGGDAYREFNFSPSGAWAIYDFTGYRDGMDVVNVGAPPRITRDAAALKYSVRVGAALLRGLRAGHAAIAVTAVLEGSDAQLSYWSLRHPPGKPDFHHRDGFILGWPLAAAAADSRKH